MYSTISAICQLIFDINMTSSKEMSTCVFAKNKVSQNTHPIGCEAQLARKCVHNNFFGARF